MQVERPKSSALTTATIIWLCVTKDAIAEHFREDFKDDSVAAQGGNARHPWIVSQRKLDNPSSRSPHPQYVFGINKRAFRGQANFLVNRSLEELEGEVDIVDVQIEQAANHKIVNFRNYLAAQ